MIKSPSFHRSVILKGIFLFLLVCTAVSFSSCQLGEMSPYEIHDYLEGLARNLGSSQLTKDGDLIGKRTPANDSYTGKYNSQCRYVTGRDVVFGGASTERRKVILHGFIRREKGNARIRVRMNEEVTELQINDDGSFAMELNMESGGNYIMVCYDNFKGEVELVSDDETVLSDGEISSCGKRMPEQRETASSLLQSA